MGSEFVSRKSSVWAKKSDTKPSLFTSRSFSSPTNKENTVDKKELPSEVPPPDYIFSKMGFNPPEPSVQREVESPEEKEPEQEVNLSRSSDSPIVDEGEKEETLSPSLEDGEKEEDLGNQSVQTKLTVGEPGDKYEQEADTVAAKVVEQINSPKTEQPVQGKVEPVVKPTVMRQGGATGGTVNRDVEQNIQQARGGGQGLSDNVRQPMEQAFGADFSGVKVHTDGQADTLNRSLNSRAFATGQDIFFKQGEYNPGSKHGQKLLAHELTHVVQQGTDASSKVEKSALPQSPFEQIIRMSPPITNSDKSTSSLAANTPKIPSFKTLISNYPLGSSEEVKNEIGGKVNYPWIKNTCAIRMSRALNYSGYPIPKTGRKTISGADKKQYFYRIADLKKYIVSKFGQSNYTFEKPLNQPELLQLQGIIIFDVNFSDATGHITLLNKGKSCINNDDYFDRANFVEIWSAK